MRSTGGVYQPTTTGLNGPDKSWSTGPRFLGPGGTTTGSRVWPKSMVLLLAGLFAVMGLAMVIVGSKWHHELTVAMAAPPQPDKGSTSDTEEGGASPPNPAPSATPYITILVVGLLLMLVAFVGLLAYYRSLGVNLPCCPGKIAHIRQRLNSQSKYPSGAPICAQYCPPTSTSTASPSSPTCSTSPTTQQPTTHSAEPPFADVSEQQRLMSEDTERMLEDDPRIVLSPLKSHEEC